MRRDRYVRFTLALVAGTVTLPACGGGNLGSGPLVRSQVASSQIASNTRKIQHVVIIIQENRSFDNLFQGFPGANTQSYGYGSNGQKIKLGRIGLETTWDLDHSSKSFLAACNGKGSYPGTDCRMNGFNKEYAQCGHPGYPSCPITHPQYAFVPQTETKPYFDMAKQYVLADRMFASDFDASSFVAHQYLIAAQSSSAVNYPSTTEWGCEGGPYDKIQTLTQQRQIHYGHPIRVCFDNETLGDELDRAGLAWRYYTAATPHGDGAFWSAYSAINHIYNGPDWQKDVISPQKLFFNDVKNGNLSAVTWITPTSENSDHAGRGSNTGPAWVASLVNAVGESRYWNSTAIFVIWDDYGGWFDHVPPKMLDYDGLGFRSPLLVISPYAKQGYVSHMDYEFAGILRFVEDLFGLHTLSASDARATSPAGDCFNFSQTPRQFKVIPTGLRKDYFLHQAPDLRPLDNQ